MKKLFKKLFVGLMLVIPSTVFAEVYYAWWVTVEFVPVDTEIEGIPVTAIDNSWVKASVLTNAMLPSEAKREGESVEDNGLSFSLNTAMDNTANGERSIVGVYETKSKVRGSFLLITALNREGLRSKRALFTVEENYTFSALKYNAAERTLGWWSCMQCDGLAIISFKHDNHTITVPEEP